MTKQRATSGMYPDTRRTTRPLLELAERTTATLNLRGTVGEALRHRQEIQPLVDCESSEEWS